MIDYKEAYKRLDNICEMLEKNLQVNAIAERRYVYDSSLLIHISSNSPFLTFQMIIDCEYMLNSMDDNSICEEITFNYISKIKKYLILK